MALSKALKRKGLRWLYIGHRWTGIFLCLLFAIWFVSGVVMMYVPFPSFRTAERVEGAAPIDWAKVRVGPKQALETLGLKAFPDEMRLGMTADQPVYRFVTEDGRRAVSAATGQEITRVTAGEAANIASAYFGAPATSTDPVEHDQWVVTRAYKRMAPFWRVHLNDAAGTDVYVAQKTGEIVQNTTAHERFWNWLGAVPHWIYFEALRVYQEPWRQTVLWTSGIGILGGIAGIWIGILRMRLRRRYSSGSVSPYRGWMKWHHVTGLIGGVFLVTWVFSGWLSMSPWGGFRDQDGAKIAERYHGADIAYPALDTARLAMEGRGAREVAFDWLAGRPVAMVYDGTGTKRSIDAVTGRPLQYSQAQLVGFARRAMPGAALTSVELLTKADSYWISTGDPRRDGRPLPVLRVKFGDPSHYWLHIAPSTGELLGQMGDGSRTYRWLFGALHTFDLPVLLAWRPLRDGLMWILSAFGLAVSVTGVVIGWRHLRHMSARRRAKRARAA